MNSGNTLLLRGYSANDVDDMARRAALDSWAWTPWPFAERQDIARFAIVEHLLTTEAEALDFWLLVKVGKRAIQAALHDHAHHHGIRIARAGQPGGGPMPKFHTYWWSTARHSRSPEDLLIDPIALVQIWPRLIPKHQNALVALATYGDYEQAAASLGLTWNTFKGYIGEARKHFFRLWHQGETPSKMWGHDQRKRTGTDRATGYSITFRTIRRRRARRRAS